MKTHLITITEKDSRLTFDTPGTYVVFFKNISGDLSCTITVPHVTLYMIGLYDMDKEKNTKSRLNRYIWLPIHTPTCFCFL